MPTLTIRQLDEKTKAKLRVRAARHGRSMEAEARELLHAALKEKSVARFSLADAIHERFAALGGVELESPKREPAREPPDFSE